MRQCPWTRISVGEPSLDPFDVQPSRQTRRKTARFFHLRPLLVAMLDSSSRTQRHIKRTNEAFVCECLFQGGWEKSRILFPLERRSNFIYYKKKNEIKKFCDADDTFGSSVCAILKEEFCSLQFISQQGTHAHAVGPEQSVSVSFCLHQPKHTQLGRCRQGRWWSKQNFRSHSAMHMLLSILQAIYEDIT